MPVNSLPPYLSLAEMDRQIDNALAEDVGPGDVTTRATVPTGQRATGRFIARQEGVLAGVFVATRVFQRVDPEVAIDWAVDDGAPIKRGDVPGVIRGRAHSLLIGERLALNLLQRMSGIATLTRRMADAAAPHRARILDTRKTAPGLRLLDKWAVKLGGGENHRIGLYDRILIKDNHIAAAGGIATVLAAALAFRNRRPDSLLIEIEARTLDEVRAVLAAGGADIILLDNMVRLTDAGAIDTSLLEEAVRFIAGRLVTEASGNVTLATVPAIAATGVDFISSGALTHSVEALDIALKIDLTNV
ncbi:MAG: carboxylating nicotinate-nucleotide diphosphorylase [Rhodothermales bacterium]|nr:carboxylating nicotinate-nucleotide diphosphorylase [Rhodothermales bacterium]